MHRLPKPKEQRDARNGSSICDDNTHLEGRELLQWGTLDTLNGLHQSGAFFQVLQLPLLARWIEPGALQLLQSDMIERVKFA